MKPRHHQLVPSRYGTWWGLGSEVRGMVWWWGEGRRPICAALVQALLGGTSCWDDRPPKRGKVEEGTVRCMP